MEGNKWKGDRYNMAAGTNTNVLLYNQDLFNRAGMAPPNKDWGWNELLDAAVKLTRRPSDPAQAQFGFVCLDTARYAIGPWMWMNGSLDVSEDMTKSLIDSPKSREALQWLADLIHKHRVWPTPQELPELGVSNMRQLLDSGRVAMAYAGYWLREEYMRTPPAFPYEIAEPPKGPATRAGFYHQGPFHIGKDSRIPDDSWTFLSWLVGVDGITHFFRNIPGGLPGRRSVARQKEFLDLLGPVPLAVVEYSREWPLHPELANLERELNQGLTPVWRGESSVQAATENIARAQNALLQKPE
jgi:multiple sugar transport system substrate-binding protein